MGHNKPVAISMSPWYKFHRDHDFDVLSTTQIVFICHTCELMITADAIAAGFILTSDAAIDADDLLVLTAIAEGETDA